MEGGEEDAARLEPLTEDTLLHYLHHRYNRDAIYTWAGAGNGLLCVNPGRGRRLPLYAPSTARAHLSIPHSHPHHTPHPHLYGVMAAALRSAAISGKPQCLLITGESGSGKSEAARVLVQGAALAGKGVDCSVGPLLAAAGTALEAFGHAATPRNHNASRYGKLLDIEFDFKQDVVGGYITHYLLETERVWGGAAGRGERNFHVFYQLLAGADVRTLKRLKLHRSWERYRALRCDGGAAGSASPRRLRPVDSADAEHFAHTEAALAALGIRGAEWEAVLEAAAFVLKLCEAKFEPAHNVDQTLGARLLPPTQHELEEACTLVGVCDKALRVALVGGCACVGACECGAAPAEWAAARRDALAAATYERLFSWLVARANAAIQGSDSSGSSAEGASVCVVDVYGLEECDGGGVWQLCVNMAAERVHAAATRALRDEMRRSRADRVPCEHRPLHRYEHAAEIIQTLVVDSVRESVSAGELLSLLRRAASAAPSVLTVCVPHHFTVSHYGGIVTYDARGVWGGERAAADRRCVAALADANHPLLAQLFSSEGTSPRRWCGGGALSRQRLLLGALTRRVEGGAVRLVRCVRADPLLRPQRFDAALVRHQLRTQGILDMLLVRQGGWSECVCAHAFERRYGMLTAKSGITRLVASLRLPRGALTITADGCFVYIRTYHTVCLLEFWRTARVQWLVRKAQRAYRAYRARCKAVKVIARSYKRYKARRGYTSKSTRQKAVCTIWRAWCMFARRNYLEGLWTRLPARHESPVCGAWPPCPRPVLLAHTDRLLCSIHHAWRCRKHRLKFDQVARNRMREKVTCSALFSGRKAGYARSVAHPFAGDYVRLRAARAWQERSHPHDRYLVFADLVGKIRRDGRVSAAVCAVSTAALSLLDPRSLRARRRLPATNVRALSLSPFHDDLLVVHTQEEIPTGASDAGSEWGGCGGESSSEEATGEGTPCLFTGGTVRRGWRGEGRGDVALRACHALELATKLFLVVQNARQTPPHLHIAAQFEANLGGQPVTVVFHPPAPGGSGGPARIVRRGARLDVIL